MISAVSNTPSLGALFQLHKNEQGLADSLRRLSTGKKINSGKDDPAGLISAERLDAALRALDAETRSLRRQSHQAQVVDGQVSQVGDMLGELNGLAVAAANSAGLTEGEQQALQVQADALYSSISRFATDAGASLDGIALPDGGNATVQAYLNDAVSAAASVATGGGNSLSGGDLANAQAVIASAVAGVASAQGVVGGYVRNTVEPGINSNSITSENLSASLSRIRDTDYAEETSRLNRQQVLTAANIEVLRVAQHESRRVLDLLAS